MSDLTPETLAELRRLLDAATPGPWRDEMMQGKGVTLTAIIAGRPNPDDLRVIGSTLAHNDARVLIAAVNALPALLDAAELLADVRDQVTRGALCPMCSTGMTRRTVGLVCQLCGTDYARPEYASMRRGSTDTHRGL